MTGGFHPKDIERIKSKDIWLQRFLEQEDLDPDASLKMLWNTCKWRKEFGANGTNAIYFCSFLIRSFDEMEQLKLRVKQGVWS